MSRKLTSSDRKSLIKLAGSLPKGSEERRAILAGLKKAGATFRFSPKKLKSSWFGPWAGNARVNSASIVDSAGNYDLWAVNVSWTPPYGEHVKPLKRNILIVADKNGVEADPRVLGLGEDVAWLTHNPTNGLPRLSKPKALQLFERRLKGKHILPKGKEVSSIVWPIVPGDKVKVDRIPRGYKVPFSAGDTLTVERVGSKTFKLFFEETNELVPDRVKAWSIYLPYQTVSVMSPDPARSYSVGDAFEVTGGRKFPKGTKGTVEKILLTENGPMLVFGLGYVSPRWTKAV